MYHFSLVYAHIYVKISTVIRFEEKGFEKKLDKKNYKHVVLFNINIKLYNTYIQINFSVFSS